MSDRFNAIRKILTSEDYSLIELYEAIEFCVRVIDLADKLAKTVDEDAARNSSFGWGMRDMLDKYQAVRQS